VGKDMTDKEKILQQKWEQVEQMIQKLARDYPDASNHVIENAFNEMIDEAIVIGLMKPSERDRYLRQMMEIFQQAKK